MKTSKSSWKNEPMSKEKESLEFEGFYTDLDAEKMMNGFIPEDTDDEWFIYFDEGWLHFHRSRTGYCIFMVKLDGSPSGVRVVKAWVTRDKKQYDCSDSKADITLLNDLITHLLIENRESK